MIDINDFHPFPRYGVAAAAIRFDVLDMDFSSEEDLLRLAGMALEDCLTGFLLQAQPITGQVGKYHFHQLPMELLDPGSKSGQVSSKGYFIAPHVLTSNNAADAVKEIKNLIEQLKSGKTNSSYELKRSFAPLISKINGGNPSMSNPRVDLLHAAFTAVAMATSLKPSAYAYDLSANAGIIPDLPFQNKWDGNNPLFNFISLFGSIQSQGLGEDAYLGDYLETEKRYRRPPVFYGNFPDSPKTSGLGALSLLAAVGKWTLEKKTLYPELFDKAGQVLSFLVERPIYIISYGGTRQEKYGHHLVGMAMSGELSKMVKSLPFVSLPNVDETRKLSDPKWDHLKRTFDHFLRFFTRSTWRDFLAIRASYPREFNHLFKIYFMDQIGLPEDWVKSAMAYGRSLNNAAYKAAKKEQEEDQKAGRQGRTLIEYKNRILVQFESTIRSAKTNSALLSQIGIIVGRLTMQDITSDAALFMQKVAEQQIDLSTAKELMTAFMRLSTYQAKPSIEGGDAEEKQLEDITQENS